MNDYDRRQLMTMREQLDAYDSGKADLSALISNLEAVQALLQTMPESWRSDFREAWGVLEMTTMMRNELGSMARSTKRTKTSMPVGL